MKLLASIVVSETLVRTCRQAFRPTLSDSTLTLKWGGDPREEMAALVFCAALGKVYDAIIQADDMLLSVDQTVKKANALQE